MAHTQSSFSPHLSWNHPTLILRESSELLWVYLGFVWIWGEAPSAKLLLKLLHAMSRLQDPSDQSWRSFIVGSTTSVHLHNCKKSRQQSSSGPERRQQSRLGRRKKAQASQLDQEARWRSSPTHKHTSGSQEAGPGSAEPSHWPTYGRVPKVMWINATSLFCLFLAEICLLLQAGNAAIAIVNTPC